MICLTNLTRARTCHDYLLMKLQTQVVRRLIQVSLDEDWVQCAPSGWRKTTPLMIKSSSLWPDQPMAQTNSVSFTHGYAAKTYPDWHLTVPRFCCISKEAGFLKGISVVGLKSLLCVCSTLLWSLWRKLDWIDRGRRFSVPFRCSGPRVPVLRRFVSGGPQKRWTSTLHAGKRVVISRTAPFGWKLSTCHRALGPLCHGVQLSKCHRSLVTQWGLVSAVFLREHWVNLLSHLWSIIWFSQSSWKDCVPRILTHNVQWVKAHKQFGLELEERRSPVWVLLRTWRKEGFLSCGCGLDQQLLWQFQHQIVYPGASFFAVSAVVCLSFQLLLGHLIECYKQYLGRGYTKRMFD